MPQVQNTRAFTITQAALGSPLEWTPAMGSAELDALIDSFVLQPLPLGQKRAMVTLQFFNSFDEHLLDLGPVIRNFELAPTAASPVHDSQPVAATYGTKRARETSPICKTSAVKRVPGFSILTKDGVDITEYASRGPKSKEQKEHAALMRKLKACPRCKRSKQRCDPSHHGISNSPSTSSPSSTTMPSPNRLSRPSYFTASSESSSSISPLVETESFFPSPSSGDYVESCSRNVSPYQRSSASISSSDLPIEIKQIDTEALARIETRRQYLLQQQAELDAELAALVAPRTPSMSFGSQPTFFDSSISILSHAVQSQLSSQAFAFHASDYSFDHSFDFDFDTAGVTPTLTHATSSSGSQGSTPSSSEGSGTLASPSRRRLATPDIDIDSFLTALSHSTAISPVSSNINEQSVQCHGDAPFDHNYRTENSRLGAPRRPVNPSLLANDDTKHIAPSVATRNLVDQPVAGVDTNGAPLSQCERSNGFVDISQMVPQDFILYPESPRARVSARVQQRATHFTSLNTMLHDTERTPTGADRSIDPLMSDVSSNRIQFILQESLFSPTDGVSANMPTVSRMESIPQSSSHTGQLLSGSLRVEPATAGKKKSKLGLKSTTRKRHASVPCSSIRSEIVPDQGYSSTSGYTAEKLGSRGGDRQSVLGRTDVQNVRVSEQTYKPFGSFQSGKIGGSPLSWGLRSLQSRVVGYHFTTPLVASEHTLGLQVHEGLAASAGTVHALASDQYVARCESRSRRVIRATDCFVCASEHGSDAHTAIASDIDVLGDGHDDLQQPPKCFISTWQTRLPSVGMLSLVAVLIFYLRNIPCVIEQLSLLLVISLATRYMFLQPTSKSPTCLQRLATLCKDRAAFPTPDNGHPPRIPSLRNQIAGIFGAVTV